MTRNISFLSNFEEIDEGYVAFGGNPKGDKISGKGKIKTGKLDFDDVYFVKELKFNLFNVSQMYDKKNSVLFTETECVVLSSDYKPPDENYVLLRVPRENNMYNVDLKNVVPSGDLTCLFAKATLDESNLWHKRLGHINFKTMNKLVKGNIVRERKNRTLIEAAKTMLADSLLPIPFWAEAVNTVCYVQNRVLVTKPHNKTPYELLLGRSPSIGFMRPFRCPITILNTLDPLGKFDGKADEGFLVGYSINSKAFKVFNSRTKIVQKTLHINFHENKPNVAGIGPKWLFDIDTLTMFMNYQPVITGNQPNDHACIKENLDAGKVGKETLSAQQYVLLPLWSTGLQDPQNIGDDVADAAFDVKENENDVHVYANGSTKTDNKKHDEKAKNMTELEDIVYSDDEEDVGAEADLSNLETNIHGHTQEEGIDYDKVFASVARIEAIRLFLAYASFMGFMVYQMDVKSAFLYETIEEEVDVYQPPRFEESDYPDKELCKAFERLMKDKFQMSSMGELIFFLGLQVKQKDDEIFISQDKYVAKILRKFGFTDIKSASTHIETEKPLLKDPDGEDVDVHIYRDSPFNLVAYSDSDYAGASLDRKSTTRGCQFLGCRFISWQCKKQTGFATSSTEAEYVAAASCCAQVLWIQNQLLDYGKELASPKQTALGKDISNPFMTGSLPKII
nr:ribonuclease H-like domain-containing protein [Tanacetum cinerariifolium]